VTFSIVAFDERSHALGVAAGSGSSLQTGCFVGATSGAGLVASQGAFPLDPAQRDIARLTDGTDPREFLASLLEDDPEKDQRQILIVDARGRTAAHSGRGCRRLFAHTEGTDHVAAGDNLPSPNVVGAMSLSFERSGGDPLWERLLLALESGTRAGGDRNGTRAATLVVYTEGPTPAVNLRVADHDDPIAELRRLLADHLSS
jgi:uncharacterized Ntn-hydrolase superfamily protein